MSKAFTKESDSDTPDLPVLPPRPSLPPGVKNYLTRDGANRFQNQIHDLEIERSESAKRPDKNPDRIAKLDLRIRQLQEILQTVDVVDPPKDQDRVRFGATVHVVNPRGEKSAYRIVGVDEIDLDRDWVSWQSPLARALLNHQIGDQVRFRSPAGEQQWVIEKIEF